MFLNLFFFKKMGGEIAISIDDCLFIYLRNSFSRVWILASELIWRGEGGGFRE